jgi:glycosyltransferase involved in cell wall biosynthesis
MNAALRLSIALPLYNSEGFLAEQLESFRNQTRLPDELVVSDDCSVDRSVAIIKDFAAKAPFPVRLSVNQHNLGMSRNFEHAFELCKGDIIFPSDGDDIWLPSKLGRMEAAFIESPDLCLVVCNSDLVDRSLQPLGRPLVRDAQLRLSIRSLLARANPLGPWILLPFAGHAMAFHANCLPWFTPIPDIALFERGGWDTWVGSVIGATGRWKLLQEPPLVLYRQHVSQASGGAKVWSRTWVKRRLAESSNHYYLQRAREADLILQRILHNGLPEVSEAVQFLQERREHFNNRAVLRNDSKFPLLIILNELFKLRYHKHSLGFFSALKDFVSTR